jgi:hypothetical protein
VGDDYSQIIIVTNIVALIELQQNAKGLELCKAMKQAWCIKGHINDNEEDNDVNNDSVGLETSLGTVKNK